MIKINIKSTSFKKLLSNLISLSILQIVNYILPLVTFPYLVKVLGIEKFGLLAFATAVVTYFNILTDYGFSLIATKEVSVNRHDIVKLNEIFSSVMIIKIGFLILSIIFLTLLIINFDKFKKDYLVYYFSFGIVIGQVMFPQWFFQGIEEMKYITILNIFAKLIFTVSIFVFIHNVNDYLYVPLLNSLGYILSGIIALYLIFKKYQIKFYFVKLNKILWYLKESWDVFISRVFISGFTNTNTFLIGVFFDHKIVGYYSIATKLISIIESFLSIFSQVLFPYISRLIKENKNKALKLIKYILFKGSILLIILLLIVHEIAPFVYEFLLSTNFMLSLKIFNILLIKVLFMYISMIIGQQILLPLNYKKVFSYSLIFGSVVNLLLIVPVLKFLGIIGLAYLVVFVNLIILIIRVKFILNKRILNE